MHITWMEDPYLWYKTLGSLLALIFHLRIYKLGCSTVNTKLGHIARHSDSKTQGVNICLVQLVAAIPARVHGTA